MTAVCMTLLATLRANSTSEEKAKLRHMKGVTRNPGTRVTMLRVFLPCRRHAGFVNNRTMTRNTSALTLRDVMSKGIVILADHGTEATQSHSHVTHAAKATKAGPATKEPK